MQLRQSLRSLRKIELDNLGGAGTDEEKQPDLGPARQQLRHDPVEDVHVGIRATKERGIHSEEEPARLDFVVLD